MTSSYNLIVESTLCPIKREHQTFHDNSVKSLPIFKILALLKSERNFIKNIRKNCTASYLCCHTTLGNSKVQISLKFINKPCKSYDIDTKSQMKRLLSHCWMISVLINVTAFVESVHPLPAHKHEDGHTPLINCTVNDGLDHAVQKRAPNAAWVRQSSVLCNVHPTSSALYKDI